MKKLLLAATAVIALPSCDSQSKDGEVYGAVSNKCRDAKGRFAKGCVVCPDGTVLRVGQTECPTPPPPPPPPVDPLTGEAPIASEFDFKLGLEPSGIPGTAAPDTNGAFRFICGGDGQLLRDDPIVYPGQPGASHLHQFYGNLGANAHSTYASLRKTGGTNCGNLTYPLNRSAYWMPAMLDGKGNVVRPDHVQIYYKRRPKSDPKCQGFDNGGEGKCINLPNGLKFIFGYDMLTGKAPTGSFDFICAKEGSSNSPAFKTIEQALAYPQCSAGGRFVVRGKAPSCSDGRLDSANHRDHVAYHVRDRNTGVNACPATHPYVIPAFTLLVSYSIGEGDDIGKWLFSSDEMHPDLPRGSTFHADFFMAWDPEAHKLWEDFCLDKLLNCSSGVLGNGFKMKGATAPSYGWANPKRLVPVSSIPKT